MGLDFDECVARVIGFVSEIGRRDGVRERGSAAEQFCRVYFGRAGLNSDRVAAGLLANYL